VNNEYLEEFMKDKNPRFIAKPQLKKLLSKSDYKNQKEFADKVGVGEPTISRFDVQTRYDINTLASISRELGIKIDDLFIIEENPDYRGTQRTAQSNKSERE
jgi:transcriptional regulator with XRE-family HTH domain